MSPFDERWGVPIRFNDYHLVLYFGSHFRLTCRIDNPQGFYRQISFGLPWFDWRQSYAACSLSIDIIINSPPSCQYFS
jgi:hypothetical protein